MYFSHYYDHTLLKIYNTWQILPFEYFSILIYSMKKNRYLPAPEGRRYSPWAKTEASEKFCESIAQ